MSYGCNYIDIDATCAIPQGQVDTTQHVGIFKAMTAQYHSECTVLLALSINESAQDLMRASGVSEGVVTNRTHEHNEEVQFGAAQHIEHVAEKCSQLCTMSASAAGLLQLNSRWLQYACAAA